MNKAYVYTLENSLTGLVFYVGMGTGDRVKHHIRNASRDKENYTPTEQTIRSIWEEGGRIIIRKPYKNLPNHEALFFERKLIEHYGYEQLVNKEWYSCHQNQWSPPKGKRNGW